MSTNMSQLTDFNYSFCDEDDNKQNCNPNIRGYMVTHDRIEILQKMVRHQCSLQTHTQQLLQAQSKQIQQLQATLNQVLKGTTTVQKNKSHKIQESCRNSIRIAQSSRLKSQTTRSYHRKQQHQQEQSILNNIQQKKKIVQQQLQKRLYEQSKDNNNKLPIQYVLSYNTTEY